MSGSVPLLVLLAVIHGLGFSIAPIMFTVPFEIPGISQREIGAAAGLFETAVRFGGVIGPLVSGFIQEATNDLQLSLVVTSLCALSLIVTAFMVFGREKLSESTTGTGH